MDPMGNICKKYFYMKSQNLLTANLDGMFLALCSNKCVVFFYVNLKSKMAATAEQNLSIGTYEKAKEYFLSQELET